MPDISKKGPSGRSYKITSFSKEYAKRKGYSGRHYLALFEAGQLESKLGWWCSNLRHAKADGSAFINREA